MESFGKTSVRIYWEKSVSVTEIKLWLAGANYAQGPLMNSIYAFQSPSLKVHPLGSQGYPNIIIPVIAAMTNKPGIPKCYNKHKPEISDRFILN